MRKTQRGFIGWLLIGILSIILGFTVGYVTWSNSSPFFRQDKTHIPLIVDKPGDIESNIFVKCPIGWEFFDYKLNTKTKPFDGSMVGCVKNIPEANTQNFAFNPSYNKFTLEEARDFLSRSKGTTGAKDLKEDFEGKDDINKLLSESGIGGGIDGITDLGTMFNIESEVTFSGDIFEFDIPNGYILTSEGASTVNFMGKKETSINKLNYIVCDNGSGLFVNQTSVEYPTLTINEFAQSFSCN
jgi:hypothetical protein